MTTASQATKGVQQACFAFVSISRRVDDSTQRVRPRNEINVYISPKFPPAAFYTHTHTHIQQNERQKSECKSSQCHTERRCEGAQKIRIFYSKWFISDGRIALALRHTSYASFAPSHDDSTRARTFFGNSPTIRNDVAASDAARDARARGTSSGRKTCLTVWSVDRTVAQHKCIHIFIRCAMRLDCACVSVRV